MVLGWAFFGSSIWAAEGGFLVQASPWLPVLVWGGSILYVIERAAKFSLFKPAEEMVYITLDDESRTKGKAAVDVLGAQVGLPADRSCSRVYCFGAARSSPRCRRC